MNLSNRLLARFGGHINEIAQFNDPAAHNIVLFEVVVAIDAIFWSERHYILWKMRFFPR